MMLPSVLILVLISASGAFSSTVAPSPARTADRTHPIYRRSEGLRSNYQANNSSNTDELLNRINDRLTALHALDEQQLKRLESLEYKITRIEVTNQERTDVLRNEVKDLASKVQNLEWMSKKLEGSVDQMKSDSEYMRDVMESSGAHRMDTRQQQFQPNNYNDISEKLDSLAVFLASTRKALNHLDGEVQLLSGNVTLIRTVTRELHQLQRSVPTKQYLNNALLNLKSQPVYAVLNGGHSEHRSGELANIPSTCRDVSSPKSGIYAIHVGVTIREPFFVNCDMETEGGGGWTVVLNRADGGVNFFRNWLEYKQGFGNLGGEFWMGLDKLHEITTSRLHEAIIILEDFEGVKKTARYAYFAIGGEKEDYSLTLLGSYSGDAGDSLSYHAGHKFSTFDSDNDSWPEGNCAQAHQGGWWYNACDVSNLNGRYLGGEASDESTRYQGIYWNEFKGSNYSLKSAKLMIRPVE